jgi:DNA-binding response OmpR family regulator
MRTKVLIIEGEQSSSVELAGPLVEAGFSVVRLPGRPDKLLALGVLNPDIVIIDAPPADDTGFYQQIRGIPGGIPIIAVCTDDGEKAGAGGLPEAYRDSCLKKPFSEADLIGKVTDMLR